MCVPGSGFPCPQTFGGSGTGEENLSIYDLRRPITKAMNYEHIERFICICIIIIIICKKNIRATVTHIADNSTIHVDLDNLIYHFILFSFRTSDL